MVPNCFLLRLFSILALAFSPGVASAAEVDVTSYGALPDDGADDAAAIQRAIGTAASGDVILLPAGTWHISAPIKPTSGVSLRGSGRDSTVIKPIGVTIDRMVHLDRVSNVTISDLTLDAAGHASVGAGINASHGSGHAIRRLGIRNLGGAIGFRHAIHFEPKVTDSVIEESMIENIAPASEWGGAIRLAHGSSRCTVVNNTIRNTGRGGILANDGSTDLVIRSNHISQSGGHGLAIEIWQDCDRAIIEDNHVDHWLSVGMSDQSAIRRNTITARDGTYKFCGLELGGGSDNVFTDNVVDGGQWIGISISNIAKNRVYWGYNSVKGATTWAVQLQGDAEGARSHYFLGNRFEGTPASHANAWFPNQGHGFRINGNTQHVVLDRNEILENGGAAVQITGSGVNNLAVVNNRIEGNARVIEGNPGGGLEWHDNGVTGNGSNSQPSATPPANQPPTADFVLNSVPTVGKQLVFTNRSFDPEGDLGNVLWDYGDGIPSSSHDGHHTYTNPGTYRVTLLVWDPEGRGGLAQQIVTVTSDDGPPAPPTLLPPTETP